MADVASGATVSGSSTPSPVTQATVDRFAALWDKVPGKILEADIEFLPTQLAVSILARSKLPRLWLKEIWAQARAGARGFAGLDREGFILSCLLAAVCKQHVGETDFPWSAVAEAMVSYSQMNQMDGVGNAGNVIGDASDDFSLSDVSFPDIPSPVPPLPLRTTAVQQAKQETPPHLRPVPPPPLPARRASMESDRGPHGNPFIAEQAEPAPNLEQLLSDEELARQLQAEELEQLEGTMSAARISSASEVNEEDRRAAENLAEEDRRRLIEIEDEEFARQLQAEEEALSRRAEAPRPMSLPPTPPGGAPLRGGSQVTLPPYAVTGTPPTNTESAAAGGITFQFFPSTDLMLPASYGRIPFGVKKAEYLGTADTISEDIYLQYGPRDNHARSGQPLLWIHFFFNDAGIARRCRDTWPRKAVVTPGVGLNSAAFAMPMMAIESASKGFEMSMGNTQRRQHFFIIKKAGDQLTETMLSKLNMIVSEVVRDPSASVSLVERPGYGSLSRAVSQTTPRPNSARQQPAIARSASSPSGPATLPVTRIANSRPELVDSDAPPPYSAQAGPTEIGNDSADASCVVCWSQPRTHSLLPCGHRSYCLSCATNILNSAGKRCAVCRQQATTVRVY